MIEISENIHHGVVGIVAYLDEKKSDIYKKILTGNWGISATKTVISKMLSKQYAGLGNGALRRLHHDGVIKLQPIYACMDGNKYKIQEGYVKLVPDDSGSDRRAFTNKLSEYGVTVSDYLDSFIDPKKIQIDPISKKPLIYTLTREQDISAPTYYFSPYFQQMIESFTLYKERLRVDVSSILLDPQKNRSIYMSNQGW